MKKSDIISVEPSAITPTQAQTNLPHRILVVDDDRDDRQLSVEVLAGSGYAVETAKDGADGWEAIQASSYDLIITDNKMPRMTGVEMIEKLRSANMTVPVIMATGEVPTNEFVRRPWLKPDATLRRPFSNDDLLAAVKKILHTDDGRNEARTEQKLRASELSYRRLFEAALDGILILGVDTGLIHDVNPFLSGLLGFSHDELVGTSIWDLGPSKDIVANKAKFEQLRQQGCVRYENLPLEAKNGRLIAVEFVSNVYQAGDHNVIQCNVRDITKRKLSDDTLRASELSYRRLFEAAKDGILILDVDTGRITDVNPFLVELLGFSHNEMVGKTVGELSPFKDIESNKTMLERLQKDGYVRYEDLPLETRDGRHIAVEFVSNVYPAGDKKIIQCNVRDITQRKAAEAALHSSELSYRRLFEAAKDGILILDVDTGRITDVNPFLVELLGFSRSEMVGKTVGELSPFKDIESNKIMLERLQKEGYVRYKDLPLETRDGRHIAVEFVSNVYPAGDKKVIQCNVRNITERKAAELVVTQLAAIVESSDAAIISQDLNSIITSWNKGAEKLFGNTAGEMVGTSIMRLIPTEWQEEENQNAEKIQRGESVEPFETPRQTKDGRLIDVSVTNSPIMDATGKVIGVSKVARDITERKAEEEKTHQLNVELEQRVCERTAQLQAANEELEAFSYSVSHDLRAPLRHVMGFVELLQKDAGSALSEKSLRHLTTISQAANRMGNLIDDLLAFSRIGQSELRKTEVHLDELVQETVGEFQARTKERNIVWEIHPLPAVRADRALLRLALVNLISNAVKFTGTRAEAKIEIGCLTEKQKAEIRKTEIMKAGVPSLLSALPISALPQEETVIFIRDNGAGFDPHYAHKMFGVFQRLHSQDEFEGTGIGLANVQRILHRHGGRTWAEGVVDGGATFYFSIPKQTET